MENTLTTLSDIFNNLDKQNNLDNTSEEEISNNESSDVNVEFSIEVDAHTEIVDLTQEINSINNNNVITTTSNIVKEKTKKGRKSKEPKVEEKLELPPWCIELNGLEKELTLNEFNKQTYHYIPVKTYNGNRSGYFICQCDDSNVIDKDTNKVIENVSSGLLSSRYVVADMTKFIDTLKDCIEASNIKVLHLPFYLNCILNTKIEGLNSFDNDSSKLVFSILSGADINTLDGLSSKLKVSASNNYSGGRSLTLSYIINTVVTINNKEFKFHDFFTLSNERIKVNHLGSLKTLTTDMSHIQPKIDENISKLKRFDNEEKLNTIAEELVAYLHKESKTKLMNYWTGLVGEFKNLYNLLLLTSVCLSESFNTKDLMNVSSYIEKTLAKLKI